jgi:hypothetical protein
MRDELRALAAPSALVTAATRAIADERRHARIVSALARRFGSDAISPRVKRPRRRSLESIAIENATEGCVRETFAALVACWQALHARDPVVRAAYARIARDEARHAELAHEAARFFESMLTGAARARVDRAREAALNDLAREAVDPSNALVQLAGLPTKTSYSRLLSRFLDARITPRVRARARRRR